MVLSRQALKLEKLPLIFGVNTFLGEIVLIKGLIAVPENVSFGKKCDWP